MNKIFNIILVAMLACLSVACSSDQEEVKSGELDITTRNIDGNWKLKTLNGEALSGNSYFYISLERVDTKFKIYDNIESGVSHASYGVFTITQDGDDKIISGVYDMQFSKPWNNEYIISNLTKTEMVWTTVGNAAEVQVFEKVESIPSDIINGTRAIN